MSISFNIAGPLPIRVAPRTGSVILPSSIIYASLTLKTKSPLVVSTELLEERRMPAGELAIRLQVELSEAASQ